MKRIIGRLPGFITAFWADTGGFVLPYVTIMLPVIVGFSLLAIDGARYMSMQTQMQAAADAIALAGARELNQRSGAQRRAYNAMVNTSFGNGNTLFGMGTSPTFTISSYTFYQSLNAASTGIGGTVPTGSLDQKDLASKFVAVTVSPVTIPTIFPVTFFNPTATNSFSAGAQAVAGFTATTACEITPIFMCNPYETSGMTPAQATQALTSALDPNDPNFSAATLRKQIRMARSSSNLSPGNFGWVQTEDGCNDTNCMRTNIAAVAGACYTSTTVTLGTGNSNSAENYFDTRFDIYKIPNPNAAITAANAPAINVRKGFLPGNNGNWCNAPKPASAAGYYTTPPVYAKSPIVITTGTTTKTGTAKNQITAMPSGDVANITAGQMITGTGIPTLTTVMTILSATSIQISNNATANGTSVPLTIKWPTSPLPLDRQWTGICTGTTCLQGNGDWDCADYWSINHPGVAAPSGCTSSNPTLSRYQIYRYEIANNRINDWSGNGLADNTNNPPGNGENGAPYCAAANGVSGVDTTTGGLDRREFITPIINCLAQNVSGSGSNATVPTAGFAKFFMTQPYEVPAPTAPAGDGSTQYLYGEMTGLVGSGDNVTILNQVQLYR
jgi:Flp pilus assembly protein TadG